MNSPDEINTAPVDDSEELDALYVAWRDDRSSASPTPLKLWLEQTPAKASSLLEWTTDAALLEGASDHAENAALVDLVAEIGTRTLSTFRARTSQGANAVPLGSLKQAAAKHGLSLKSLADALELGVPIVAKLEQRLLRLESLPNRLIERLAICLRVSQSQIRDYLRLSPTLSSAALYRADAAPRAAAQEEFVHAVKTCVGMTAKQKQTWLDADSDTRS